MMTRLIEYLGIFLIALFCAASIFFSLFGRGLGNPLTDRIVNFTSFFEDRFFDARMLKTLDKKAIDDRLVLAAIDDPSIDEIGRFPWTRTLWAEFMDKMTHFGAQVVAFDIFFSEPELPCPGETSPDEIFAESIRRFQESGGATILPYGTAAHPILGKEEVPFELFMDMLNSQVRGDLIEEQWISAIVFPVDDLLAAEPMLASIGSTQDPDGIYRQYPLVVQTEGSFFPSYALKSSDALLGTNSEVIIRDGRVGLRHNENEIYLNEKGETKVRWFGGRHNFPIVPIKNILKAPDDDPEMREIFEGNIIFVGSTAFAAHDLRHTPVDPMLPGVFYHMNMTKMLLDGHFFLHPAKSSNLSWLILILGTLFIFLIMLLKNPILDLISIVALVIGASYVDTYFLIPMGYETKLFFGLLSPVLSYSWVTFFNFYLANKEKKEIRGTFSRFVAPTIVDEMLSDPDKVKVGGTRKHITCFYSDVRDFTNISEKLTPEELANCLNEYMGVMTDIVFENKGTLDKYIGDMIVALWGAPLDVENHAYYAVKSAVAMMEALPAVNESFRSKDLPEFKHGIGLNTGYCSVGNMGSSKIFSYTALGDTMNLGARVESLCKFYGVQINISEFTREAIPEKLRAEFQMRRLDKVRVKGKEEPVILWEVLYPNHLLWNQKEALERYEEAMDEYYGQNFTKAKDIFKELSDKYPDDPSFKRMLGVCEEFIELPPPPDWDGVFTHKSKG